MHILSLEAISKNYGIKPLFENVNLGFDSSDRVGVVGVNGSGKTTLLRLIAGEERPDAGRIVFAASDAGMMLLREYEEACQALAVDDKEDERLLKRVSELAHRLEASGVWE